MGISFEGMGTQVQSKTYFPGYYSTKDLDEDVDRSWSMRHEDRTLSGHLYNGFAFRSLNGYSERDKEMLKRTMLEHEAMFRTQVYDLHRLYRIQKNMMNDFQKKGSEGISVQAETPLSKSFLSQTPFERTKRIWQMPHLPAMSTSCYTTSTTGTDHTSSPLDFFKEGSLPSGWFPTENGVSLKDRDIQTSTLKNFLRGIDLQVPADVYIHNEDVDGQFRQTVASNKIFSDDPVNDVKLTLGIGECLNREDECTNVDQSKQDRLYDYCLANLNKCDGGMFHETSAGSIPTHFLSQKTHYAAQRNDLLLSSNTSFLSLKSAKDGNIVEGSCSNFQYAAHEETRQEWLYYNTEAAQKVNFLGSSFHNQNIPTSCESIQLNHATIPETHSSTKADTWVGKKRALGIEVSGRNSCPAMSSNAGTAISGSPSLFSTAAKLNITCTAAPLLSASAKSVNVVQALPCFNGDVPKNVPRKRLDATDQGSRSVCDTWQHNPDLKPHLRPGDEPSSSHNGYEDRFELKSSSASFTQLSLNSGADFPAIWNGENHGPHKRLKSLQCTNVNYSTDVCLKQALHTGMRDDMIIQKEVGESSVGVNLYTSSNEISWLTEKPVLSESTDRKNCALGFFQGYPKLVSGSNAMDPELEQRREKKKATSLSNSPDFPPTAYDESRMQGSEVPDRLNCTRILGFPIPEKSHQNAKCVPSNHELSIRNTKEPSSEKQTHPLINLNSVPEASEETIVSLEEFMPPRKIDDSQNTEWSDEELVREAAANIVQISLENVSISNCIASVSQSPALGTLRWFADFVLSNDERSDDGLDDFELMTLQLDEIKIDEYHRRLPEPINQKEEAKDPSSQIVTSTKRRRQRRDFQKDVLPALVSLSRREVNEDLQTIGGRSSPTGFTRHSQTRGSLRSRSLALTLEDIQVSPVQQLRANAGPELDGGRMVGWGRTTRRCRRQRCPPANATAPLT